MSLCGLSDRSHSKGNFPRRKRQEDIFIRRREAEKKHRDLWNGVTDYFHYWDVKTNKYNAWVSPEYYDSSQQTYQTKINKQLKSERLASRREKLSQLLEKEKKEWEIELKERRTCFRYGRERRIIGSADLETLKAINEEAKAKREEERRSEAKLLMHKWWRVNHPVLREFESRQRKEFVQKAWQEQVEEKRVAEEEKKRLDEEAQAALNDKLKKELEEEERKQEEGQKLLIKNKQELLIQHLELLRQKERLADELKKEEAQAIIEQAEIDSLFTKQKQCEERRKKEALRLSLTKQIQLRLRRSAREAREQLEEDIKLLEAALEKERSFMESERKKKLETKAWMEEAYLQFRKQAEEAKQREEEAHTLFHEEAVRMWKRQEDRWKKEEEARNKLMQEVLSTLKQQVKERLEENYREQKELLEYRGKLLREAEEAEKELIMKEKEQAALESKNQKFLLSQIEEKQNKAEERKKLEKIETLALEEKEKEETEKLVQEIKRMKLLSNPMVAPDAKIDRLTMLKNIKLKLNSYIVKMK